MADPAGSGVPANPPGAPELRVLLVEDYEIYRRGLQTVVDSEPGMRIVGQTGSAIEAVPLAAQVRPDVVLMDIYLPDGSGIDTCRRLSQEVGEARVLMLTASDDDSDLVAAIKAGATGYLLKDVAPDMLPDAIRSVASGQALLSPALASTLLSEFAAVVRQSPEDSADAALTDREREVLRHVARGWSNKRIAQELFISENTVKNHVRNILDKLQLRSRTEAALYAVRGGLIDESDD